MNHDNERKAFEAWVESKYNANFMQFALDLDLYVDKHTQTCWESWLASANREGYKLVPVEPSDHMKCVVRDFDPDIEDYANMDNSEWESLCSDIYKAMIGACDE